MSPLPLHGGILRIGWFKSYESMLSTVNSYANVSDFSEAAHSFLDPRGTRCTQAMS